MNELNLKYQPEGYKWQKIYLNFEFPAWRRQNFSNPGNEIGHQFRIHLGNPLLLIILD